jgi:hypothetical protein
LKAEEQETLRQVRQASPDLETAYQLPRFRPKKGRCDFFV